jgi:hypothetical protein
MINHRIKLNLRLLTLKLNYLLNNYDHVIWLLGDGRSGTTWVSNLINYHKTYRKMFEPFHPEVEEMNFLYPYLRVEEKPEEFLNFSSKVFSGDFFHPRVDQENKKIFYQGLLIKDIFANLLAYWVSKNFPEVKIILLIRNPFSVALSKKKTKSWSWLEDPSLFLRQRELYEDYLYPFEETIWEVSKYGNYLQKQVLIWSIINYVPLTQFASEMDKIYICFYEKICQYPEAEVSKMYSYLYPDYFQSEKQNVAISKQEIEQPSFVSLSHNKATDNQDSSKSQEFVTVSEQKYCMSILQKFGLHNLYSENSFPN